MHDADNLYRRALLAAMMAECYGLSEVGEALLQAAERLPRHAASLPGPVIVTRSHC